MKWTPPNSGLLSRGKLSFQCREPELGLENLEAGTEGGSGYGLAIGFVGQCGRILAAASPPGHCPRRFTICTPRTSVINRGGEFSVHRGRSRRDSHAACPRRR